jgi:hypothetical protein
MLNAQFIILQSVSPLCDYKMWIDTERGTEAISYLCLMAQLNMMEEKFCTHRMEERQRSTYFAMRREMDRKEYKEK